MKARSYNNWAHDSCDTLYNFKVGQIFSGHYCLHKGGRTIFFLWPKLILLAKGRGPMPPKYTPLPSCYLYKKNWPTYLYIKVCILQMTNAQWRMPIFATDFAFGKILWKSTVTAAVRVASTTSAEYHGSLLIDAHAAAPAPAPFEQDGHQRKWLY